MHNYISALLLIILSIMVLANSKVFIRQPKPVICYYYTIAFAFLILLLTSFYKSPEFIEYSSLIKKEFAPLDLTPDSLLSLIAILFSNKPMLAYSIFRLVSLTFISFWLISNNVWFRNKAWIRKLPSSSLYDTINAFKKKPKKEILLRTILLIMFALLLHFNIVISVFHKMEQIPMIQQIKFFLT